MLCVEDYAGWIGITATQAIFLCSSLLVVRACGYRLIRTQRLQNRTVHIL
jgi:hypothetical protein